MSQVGIRKDELEDDKSELELVKSRGTRWCFPASLLAAWTFSSQFQQSAASSAQQTTAAAALSHTSHSTFMEGHSPPPLTLRRPTKHHLPGDRRFLSLTNRQVDP